MKTTLIGILAVVAACSGGPSVRESPPVVSAAPDDFVLRDVRKDAARYLNCQVPDVSAQVGPWAGSSGNVTATGCGYHITYYVACRTSHQCDFSIAE